MKPAKNDSGADATDLQRVLQVLGRNWVPFGVVLGSFFAAVFGGWSAGTVMGIAILACTVAVAIPLLGSGAASGTVGVVSPDSGLAEPEAYGHLLQETTTLTDAAYSYPLTLDRITRLALPLLADWVVFYERTADGVVRRARVSANSAAAEDALEHALHHLPRQLGGHDPLASVSVVMRTGQPCFLSQVHGQGLPIAGRNQGERLHLDRLEPATVIVAPLRTREQLIGVMVFARARGARTHTRSDLPRVLEYCRRAALMLDHAQRFESAHTARDNAEHARDELLAIVDNLSSGYIALDHAARVKHMNHAAELITARSRTELIGHDLWQALPPNTRDAPIARFVRDALRKQTALTTEFSVTWSGRARWLEINVTPTADGASLYLRDVTDRHALAKRVQKQEDALRHSQKMEAVGRLSGRLAHDFNNLLMSIAGCAELLARKVGADESVRADIDEILRSTERASSLTRQLLTYSRKQVHQPQVIDLGSAVMEMQRRLLHVLREDILLAVDVPDASAAVKADPNQIEQMLLNFAVNSRDAMPGSGTLTITVSKLELQSERPGEHGRLLPGRYVCLEVSDTGRGIDPEVLPHIFEPYFTTKSADRGTGLGLASVYGIVRQNHGSITVNSTPGHGTTFQILFREAQAVDDPFVAVPPRKSQAPQGVQPAGNAARAAGVILVAEDENSVRRFVCEVLRERGYTVLEARTGVEGVAVARRHAGPIDLLLTDVVMPEMGGRDLASKLTHSNSEARILFMSGYAENEIAHHGVLASGAQLLEKPFSRAMLLERVQAALLDPPAVLSFSPPTTA